MGIPAWVLKHEGIRAVWTLKTRLPDEQSCRWLWRWVLHGFVADLRPNLAPIAGRDMGLCVLRHKTHAVRMAAMTCTVAAAPVPMARRITYLVHIVK